MRQAARARKSLQILLRGLCSAIVSQWKRAIQKLVTRFRTDFEQSRAREFFKGVARFAKPLQIFAYDSAVDLAQHSFDLACAVVLYLAFIQAFIGPPAA